MTEQLCALYAERETLDAHFPGMDAAEIVEQANGLRARLAALGEGPFVALDASRRDPAQELGDSLEAQLVELYAEKEALAAAFPGMSYDEIARDSHEKRDRIERLRTASPEALATAA